MVPDRQSHFMRQERDAAAAAGFGGCARGAGRGRDAASHTFDEPKYDYVDRDKRGKQRKQWKGGFLLVEMLLEKFENSVRIRSLAALIIVEGGKEGSA